jgi:proton-dependent oligopeptide transporter, POT family
MNPATPSPSEDRSFFGHPKGLSTLFFTEMWERFSYYGMRAILLFFMTATVAKGGLGFTDAEASAMIGLFLGSVYLLSVPGGWISDKLIGMRKSVLYGGIGIAAGNALLCIPQRWAFFVGAVVIAIGTGLLKTNVSAIVGTLYSKQDARRDAGFSIYYMGINLGALIAPLICGYLGQTIDYRMGFAAAAVAMTGGLLQYVAGWKQFGVEAEAPKVVQRRHWTQFWTAVAAFLAAVAGLFVLSLLGIFSPTVELASNAFGIFLIVVVIAIFGYLLTSNSFSRQEKGRLRAIFGLFLASTVFWSLFEQAASTLSLFADRNTDNRIFGQEFPSSYYQTLNSLFIIGFAPAFAWLWTKMGNRQPSVAVKFALGLVGAAAGYLVLIPAAGITDGGSKVGPYFLVATYLFHTWGELCLSPVGLSAMTRLTPTNMGSFVMGLWFMSIAAGNYLAGRVSGFYSTMSLGQLFGTVAAAGIACALLMFLAARPLEKMSEQE